MFYSYFEILKNFIEQQDKLTAGVYILFAKVIAGVVFLPATPLTILSGVVLGFFWGSLVSFIGNLLGATLAFLLARYFLKKFVQERILKKYPKIDDYEDRLFKKGFTTVLFLRLVPIFPFNVLNFVLGVTEVKFKDYFFGTFLGIIPGTISLVYFGESVKMLSAYKIFFSVLGILGLFYLGRFWKLK